MSHSNFFAFGRLFDGASSVILLALGAMMAGASSLVGA